MKKILTAAVALGVLASAGAAAAQPYGYGRDHGRYEQRYDRGDRYNRHDRRGDRHDYRRYYSEPRAHYGQWRRGDRLPDRYRRGYAIDYRDYRLAPPPRGYEYRRVNNNDVVLAAIATGVIASVLVGLSN